MYSLRILLAILSLQIVSISALCYYPDGTLSNDLACNPNATASTCCGRGQVCLSNGICTFRNVSGSAIYNRGSCTDKNWNSSECPQFCISNSPGGGAGMYACNSGHNFCCDTNGVYQGCCADSNNFLELSPATSSVAVGVIMTATSSSTSSSATATHNTTFTTFSPTGASSTSKSSDNNHTTAIAAGVAVPVGVLLIAAAGFFIWWRRRASKRNGRPQLPETYAGNPPGYDPSQPQPDNYMTMSPGGSTWTPQTDDHYYAKVAPEPQQPPQELPAHTELQELDNTPKRQ
ncbi:hypothetical protein NA57DRAFT_59012 [Rhizodiscina lignyota]|uniref:Mid2 domain-containing protein n=1 Tax=Rhizodiscina lignyota TaxID=1504668 RepID=A0A9P4IA58_9PEZI|nr:hypothetical protein NA57DRAFT_59012 [Rhizodiscina lignyota]